LVGILQNSNIALREPDAFKRGRDQRPVLVRVFQLADFDEIAGVADDEREACFGRPERQDGARSVDTANACRPQRPAFLPHANQYLAVIMP
jgi:hypothetical protein